MGAGTYAGDVGFDPYGFGAAYNLKWMREAELKHGRICMLAIFGYIAVDRGFYAPGAPHVSSLAAHDVTVKSGHMLFPVCGWHPGVDQLHCDLRDALGRD